MLPEVIRASLTGEKPPEDQTLQEAIIPRAPTLCAGCPHRGLFYELGKLKNVIISGDIGCYTLAYAEPYNAMDLSLCMGASITMGHGAQTVLDTVEDNKLRVVSVLGDSTFIHSGLNSLINVLYNKSNTVNIILDNRITAMTGQQETPTTGITLQGDQSEAVDIPRLVSALGFTNVRTINPNDLSQVKETLSWALGLSEPRSHHPLACAEEAVRWTRRVQRRVQTRYEGGRDHIGCSAPHQLRPSPSTTRPQERAYPSVRGLRVCARSTRRNSLLKASNDQNILLTGIGGQGTILASKHEPRPAERRLRRQDGRSG